MKSFVNKAVFGVVMLIFLVMPARAQCKCTCRPSPPGAMTTCDAGDIAVCGSSGGNICTGKCVHVPLPSNTAGAFYDAIDFAAGVLSKILNKRVSSRDLETHKEDARAALHQLLDSSATDKPVKIQFLSKKSARKGEYAVGFTVRQMGILREALLMLGEPLHLISPDRPTPIRPQ